MSNFLRTCSRWLFCGWLTVSAVVFSARRTAAQTADKPSVHVNGDELWWQRNAAYPAEIRQVYRYKELLGGRHVIPPALQIEGARMGILELEPGATYPFHFHPAPEIYYVVGGTAQWFVDDHTFTATPGTAVYHRPGVKHQMVNTGSEVLRLVWFWWAPGGDADVLTIQARLVE